MTSGLFIKVKTCIDFYYCKWFNEFADPICDEWHKTETCRRMDNWWTTAWKWNLADKEIISVVCQQSDTDEYEIEEEKAVSYTHLDVYKRQIENYW